MYRLVTVEAGLLFFFFPVYLDYNLKGKLFYIKFNQLIATFIQKYCTK